MGDGAGALPVSPARAVETQAPADEPPQVRNARNYRITDEDQVGVGSLKQKARDNLAAIEVLQRLERETRSPTADELRQLVRFVGWGGLPQVFDSWNKEWKTERERLESLLSENELESACGLGHFIGLMPEDMLRQSQITGIEIDSVTARLAKQLYPDAEIRRQPFEETRLADSFFDVAISNIPFGDYKPFDARFKKWKFVIHDYFFATTLEKVRPGGLILFVTSKGTLDKVEGGLRELISQQADLLGAIRLPNDAFKKNANTEVTTDIVMLRKRLPGESPKGPA